MGENNQNNQNENAQANQGAENQQITPEAPVIPETPANQQGQAGGNQPGGTESAANPEPENTQPSEPEEIIDLDVPLAGPDTPAATEEEPTEEHKIPIAGIVGGGLGVIAVILALLYALVFRKKNHA